MRRAIQITAVPETDDRHAMLYALCNDGTIWKMAFRPATHPEWAQLPNVPASEAQGDGIDYLEIDPKQITQRT
jgi:hypothetical protein